jgi:hypothetical protein
MIKCFICGAKNEDGASYCKNCGVSFKANVLRPPETPQSGNLFGDAPGPQETYNETYQHYASKKEPGSATASLLLGILAVVLCVLNYFGVYFVHIAGTFLGAIAVTLSRLGLKIRDGKAIFGLVFGIIAIILGVVAFIIGAIAGVLNAAGQI